MKRLLATTLLSLVCCAANAEWKLIGSSDLKGGIYTYIENANIRISGDIAKVWMMYSFKTPQHKIQFRSLKALTEINCKEFEYRGTSEVTYRSDDGTGEFLDSNNFPNSKWEPIVPDSNLDVARKSVCTK